MKVDACINGRILPLHVEKSETKPKTLNLIFDYNFELKEEIKHSCGRWDNDNKIWTAPDNLRTKYVLDNLSLGPMSSRYYDTEIKEVCKHKVLKRHQREMVNFWLTRKRCLWNVEMGLGKTFAALVAMSQYIQLKGNVLIVAPKQVLNSWHNEFTKWGISIPNVTLINYAGLKKLDKANSIYQCIIFDESQNIKNFNSQAAIAGFNLSQRAYETYGEDSYVLVMTGTAVPLSYVDLWSQLEIAQPGFVREKNAKRFLERFSYVEEKDFGYGPSKQVRFAIDHNCVTCNLPQDQHTSEFRHPFQYKSRCEMCSEYHKDQDCGYLVDTPPVDLVSEMLERIKYAVFALEKHSVVDLPRKVHFTKECAPTEEQLMVCKTKLETSSTVVGAMTLAREISDGFIITNKKPIRFESSPKVEALKELLEGKTRIIVFAAFTESIEMIIDALDYPIAKLNGQGLRFYNHKTDHNDLESWFWDTKDGHEKKIVVANAKTAGAGLNLQTADRKIFFSNTTNGGDRLQAESRAHRIGMNPELDIWDITCLAIDKLVLNNLKAKKTMNEFTLKEIQEHVTQQEVHDRNNTTVS